MQNHYSEEFKKVLKEAFPSSPDMWKLEDNNAGILGRYLDDSTSGSISLDEILKATTLEELKCKALLQQKKIRAYNMCMDEQSKWDQT